MGLVKYPTEEQEEIVLAIKDTIVEKNINHFERFVTVNTLVYKFWEVGVKSFIADLKEGVP